MRDLRRENKELIALRDQSESQFADLQDQVEISLLDKEVAEEQLEAAHHALEVAQEKLAEMEVEVTVLREENQKLEGEGEAAVRAERDGTGEGRTSLAFIQLEKQNSRLKEALIRFAVCSASVLTARLTSHCRLRDLTAETEAEHKRHTADLEKELDLTSDLQGKDSSFIALSVHRSRSLPVMFDNNLVELERAEAQVEELKQQLDDALGAEDLLEQLTERNLTLSEVSDYRHRVLSHVSSLALAETGGDDRGCRGPRGAARIEQRARGKPRRD